MRLKYFFIVFVILALMVSISYGKELTFKDNRIYLTIDSLSNASLWSSIGDYLLPTNTTKGLQVSSLTNCDTIDTNAQGQFVCGSDSSGASTVGGTLNITYLNVSKNLLFGFLPSAQCLSTDSFGNIIDTPCIDSANWKLSNFTQAFNSASLALFNLNNLTQFLGGNNNTLVRFENISNYDTSSTDDLNSNNFSTSKYINLTIINGDIVFSVNVSQDLCIELTGSSSLCDGVDASGTDSSAFNIANLTNWLGGNNDTLVRFSNISNYDTSYADDFNKANYTAEYSSTGFDRENVSEYLGGSGVNASLLKVNNLTAGTFPLNVNSVNASVVNASVLNVADTLINSTGAFSGDYKLYTGDADYTFCEIEDITTPKGKELLRECDYVCNRNNDCSVPVERALADNNISKIVFRNGNYTFNQIDIPSKRPYYQILGQGKSVNFNQNNSVLFSSVGNNTGEFGGFKITITTTSTFPVAIDFREPPTQDVYIHDVDFGTRQNNSEGWLCIRMTTFSDDWRNQGFHRNIKVERVTCNNQSFTFGPVDGLDLGNSQFIGGSPSNNVLADIGYGEHSGTHAFNVNIHDTIFEVTNPQYGVTHNGNTSVSYSNVVFKGNRTYFIDVITDNEDVNSYLRIDDSYFIGKDDSNTYFINVDKRAKESRTIINNVYLDGAYATQGNGISIDSSGFAQLSNLNLQKFGQACVTIANTPFELSNSYFEDCSTQAAWRYLRLSHMKDFSMDNNHFVSKVTSTTQIPIRLVNVTNGTITRNKYSGLNPSSPYEFNDKEWNQSYLEDYKYTLNPICDGSKSNVFYRRNIVLNDSQSCYCDGSSNWICSYINGSIDWNKVLAQPQITVFNRENVTDYLGGTYRNSSIPDITNNLTFYQTKVGNVTNNNQISNGAGYLINDSDMRIKNLNKSGLFYPNNRSLSSKGVFIHIPADDSIYDLSGNNHSGSITGGVGYVPSKNDKAFSFDAKTGYVLLNQGSKFPLYNQTNLTIRFYLKAYDVSTGSQFIIAEGRSSSANPIYSIALGTAGQGANKIRIFVRNDSTNNLIDTVSTQTLSANQSYHIVMTDSNGTVALYINGMKDATSFSYTKQPCCLTTDRTAIGALVRNTVGSYFAGEVDDLVIINETWDYAQVQSDFESNTPFLSRDSILMKGGGDVQGNFSVMSNLLFVDSLSSKVGIGTTSPNEKLVVIGNVNISGTLNVSGKIAFPNLASCDTIDSDPNGVLTCGTDDGGAGGSMPVESNYRTNISSAFGYSTFGETNYSLVRIGNLTWIYSAVNSTSLKQNQLIIGSSTSDHNNMTLSIVNKERLGERGVALSVVSTNNDSSAVEFTGNESARGTLKITHNKPSGVSDSSASAISIAFRGTDGTNSAAKAIYVDTQNTTGPIFQASNDSQTQIIVEKDGGTTITSDNDYALLVQGSDGGDAFRVQMPTGITWVKKAIPLSTNTYDLGDLTHIWNNIMGRTVNVTNLNVSGRFNGSVDCSLITGGSDSNYCVDADSGGGSQPTLLDYLNNVTSVFGFLDSREMNSSIIQKTNTTWVNGLIDSRVTQSFVRLLGFSEEEDAFKIANMTIAYPNLDIDYTNDLNMLNFTNSSHINISMVNSKIRIDLNVSNALCVALTGSSDLCDGTDSGGAGSLPDTSHYIQNITASFGLGWNSSVLTTGNITIFLKNQSQTWNNSQRFITNKTTIMGLNISNNTDTGTTAMIWNNGSGICIGNC